MNLAKTAAATVFFLATSGIAWAGEINSGIKGGLNFATVSNSDPVFPPAPTLVAGSVESPRGIGGLFITARFTELVSFEPEGLYSMQGVKGVTANVHDVESNATINMFKVPLLVRIGHRRGGYVVAGPEVGFVMKATLQTTGRPDSDFKSALKSSDTSFVVGGGALFSHVLFEARYAAGLADINKTAGAVVNKNQVFSILAGIQF